MHVTIADIGGAARDALDAAVCSPERVLDIAGPDGTGRLVREALADMSRRSGRYRTVHIDARHATSYEVLTHVPVPSELLATEASWVIPTGSEVVLVVDHANYLAGNDALAAAVHAAVAVVGTTVMVRDLVTA